MAKVSTISEMDLAGGIPCLDFVNTCLNNEVLVERLHSYDDLLVLATRLDVLDRKTLAKLKTLAIKNTAKANVALQKARSAREAMYRVFSAIAAGDSAKLTSAELTVFDNYIQEAIAQRSFTVTNGKIILNWSVASQTLDLPVWVFCLSAYELLQTKEQSLIKQCGACAWLFLDETKNHRRKWCDMQTCGASEKSRRYYQRNKHQLN